jgi:hypothetical protein
VCAPKQRGWRGLSREEEMNNEDNLKRIKMRIKKKGGSEKKQEMRKGTENNFKRKKNKTKADR